MSSGKFQIYAQLHAFEKSGDANPMRIGGIVSTDELDQDGERILQEGLDFSYFLKRGWFNDNHSKKTTDVLGYPTQAQYVSKGERLPNGGTAEANGWWAEGYLINNERGRELWQLVQGLDGTPRSLGFSIEGKVRARDPRNPSKVVAAAVHHVAITHCPVNTSTELQALVKALTAGHAIGNPGASPGEGFALRQESMDEAQDHTTTTHGDHPTTEDEHGELAKSDDAEEAVVDEFELLDEWKGAFDQVDPNAGVMDLHESRAVVKAMRPHWNPAQIDAVINNARR